MGHANETFIWCVLCIVEIFKRGNLYYNVSDMRVWCGIVLVSAIVDGIVAETFYHQIEFSSRLLKNICVQNMSCSCVYWVALQFYITHLCYQRSGSLYCICPAKMSAKKCISKLSSNLAFSTFNTIWLPKLCGVSSVLVRRKQLWHNTNYEIRKYFKEF